MEKIYNLLQNIILQSIGQLKSTPSGYSKRNCMMCATRGHKPDTRQRFGIKFDNNSISMNCFNCNFSAGWDGTRTLSENFVNFLSTIGIPPTDIKRIQFDLFKQTKELSSPELITINRNITSLWKEHELPLYCNSLSFWEKEKCNDVNFLKVLEYANSRDITNHDTVFWSPSKDRQMHKRLVLPFYHKKTVVGYTGRYFREITNKQIPKYINEMPPGYLYNLNNQDADNKYMILCEGVFDAFFLQGVSPLHNTISKEQATLLNSLGKHIILTPHRDNAGQGLIDAALEYGWSVSFPPWDKNIKDASDAVAKYGRLATLQSIIECAEHRKFDIKLLRTWTKYEKK